MADRRLTDLELERWLAGDLPVERTAAASDADRARLDVLRTEHASFLAGVDVAAELGAIEARAARIARLAAPAPRVWRWWALSGGALAAAVALVVVLRARPVPRVDDIPGGSGDDVRWKGSDVSLVIHVAVGTESRPLASGAPVHPGDRLRFEIRAPGPGYTAVVGVDGAGTTTVYYPYGSTRAAAYAPSAGVLPGAIALDATPGDERIFGLYSARPFALDAGLFAALRDARVPPEVRSVAVVLHKQLAPR